MKQKSMTFSDDNEFSSHDGFNQIDRLNFVIHKSREAMAAAMGRSNVPTLMDFRSEMYAFRSEARNFLNQEEKDEIDYFFRKFEMDTGELLSNPNNRRINYLVTSLRTIHDRMSDLLVKHGIISRRAPNSGGLLGELARMKKGMGGEDDDDEGESDDE